MNMGAIATSALLAAAAAACAWKSAPRLGHASASSSRFWQVQAAVLFGLGVAHALAVDAWVLHWGRQAAQASGLYGWRRPFQAALLLGGLLLALLALKHWRNSAADKSPAPWRRLCAGATAVVVVVFGARAVSLHGVDAVLAYRIFDLGLGRWVEWSAAVVVAVAATFNGARAPARRSTLNAWEPPRV